jgi:endonuclease YncB( thermonuclease family)
MLRLAVVALVLWSLPVAAQERFTGKVGGVTDGDTISVMRDGRAVTVRLDGI